MKIIILTLTLLLTAMLTFAQSTEHLSFKGVPIDGTLSEYVTKMKQNGFLLLSTENEIAILSGDFAGYKDCKVGVSTLKQKDLVYKIVVLFPNKETWSTLSGNYFDLKQMLTEKYGEPSEVFEKFDTYSQSMDDSYKMHQVGMDRCKYYSVFQTAKGAIELAIDHDSVISKYVTLVYSDKINSEIMKAKAKGDL